MKTDKKMDQLVRITDKDTLFSIIISATVKGIANQELQNVDIQNSGDQPPAFS